ncbi:unnamed protein product [Microthlaspi erraticum]|uniref:ABC transmembrane type-1 domain-containing protein n=1 Tax=Microthlaspi erraticum TaxID=1685480 RepID=A0A6D2KAB1_9BRAS|nr:unnamed protein product [Microthlaspi erraticum]CAA7049980.1 unnamed protein product [Microthlaspi erraticum]
MLWRLTIVGFPFIIILLIPGLMYGRALINVSRKVREEYNEAGSIAEQAISLVRTVYAFGTERKMLSKFSAALQGSVKLGVRQGLVKGIALGSNGISYAIWGFMSCKEVEWLWTMVLKAVLSSQSSYASPLVARKSLGQSLSNLKYLSEAIVAGERIMKMVRRVPDIDSENAAVGGSGSGKSTVISLLQRFYDPLAGEILLDGVSIRELQVKWLRSQMGLVSQEPALFATSIEENILFGKEDASLDEVVEAAMASNAHHFISQFPHGRGGARIILHQGHI